MISINPVYPSPEHEQAARRITDYFSGLPEIRAVLLVNSVARGKATRDSCLDISILLPLDLKSDQQERLENNWTKIYETEDVFRKVRAIGKYSQVDLHLTRGVFNSWHGWTSGPDEYELEIGNLLAYSFPLWERGESFRDLKSQWLPYYPAALLQERLEMVRNFAINNLEHIPLYIDRGLYFQAFNRLYHAFGEFLQALFIARKTYPIAYDKWVKEQIVDILGLPELYAQLPHLLEIHQFESQEIADKAQTLRQLLDEWTDPSNSQISP